MIDYASVRLREDIAEHHCDLDDLVRCARLFCDVYRWETGRTMEARHDGERIVILFMGHGYPISIKALLMSRDIISVFARAFSDLEIVGGLYDARRHSLL